MKFKTSRIRPPRSLVKEISDFVVDQIGKDKQAHDVFLVSPPPRTPVSLKPMQVRVEVLSYRASEKFTHEAQFEPTNRVLYINLPLLELRHQDEDLEYSINKVISHELVHVYQLFYTMAKQDSEGVDMNNMGGLPSLRERTPGYRQDFGGDILNHRLDDSEFYPRLEDTINAIKYVVGDKHEMTTQVIDYLLGSRVKLRINMRQLEEPKEWLETLQVKAPRKYIKAVKKIKNEFPETAKLRTADFFRQVSPPDELSTFSNGTPTGKSTDLKDKGEGSQLPNGDGARNIGRPSPDSPNLKSRNLDRSESYGRKPAEGFDGGYVHDSGSGSARVIPYDSGFANNSSPLREAGLIRPQESCTNLPNGEYAMNNRVTKVAQRYLESKRLTQFINWVKGDSELIDECVDKIETELEKNLHPLLSYDLDYTPSQDLVISICGAPTITDINKGKAIDLNGKKITGDNLSEVYFEIEDLYFDHDLQDLYGIYEGEVISLTSELGGLSDDFEDLIKGIQNQVFMDILDIHVKEIATMLNRYSREWDKKSPIVGLEAPSSNFFGDDLKLSIQGHKLQVNKRHETTIFNFKLTNTGWETFVDVPKKYHKWGMYRVEAKKHTFKGLLTWKSCLRLVFWGWADRSSFKDGR